MLFGFLVFFFLTEEAEVAIQSLSFFADVSKQCAVCNRIPRQNVLFTWKRLVVAVLHATSTPVSSSHYLRFGVRHVRSALSRKSGVSTCCDPSRSSPSLFHIMSVNIIYLNIIHFWKLFIAPVYFSDWSPMCLHFIYLYVNSHEEKFRITICTSVTFGARSVYLL